MTTHNQLLLSLLQVLNTYDPKLLPSVFADHFRGFDCAQTGVISGPDGVWTSIQTYLHAFPDLNLQMIDAQISEQGAAVYWIARGTHLGTWMNIPPTRRPVSVQGMWMLTIDNGSITYAHSQWDVAGLLRRLGLLPDLIESV